MAKISIHLLLSKEGVLSRYCALSVEWFELRDENTHKSTYMEYIEFGINTKTYMDEGSYIWFSIEFGINI